MSNSTRNSKVCLAQHMTVPRKRRESDLEMALGVHEAPHDPKGAEEVPIGVSGQAWDDGVVGLLV